VNHEKTNAIEGVYQVAYAEEAGSDPSVRNRLILVVRGNRIFGSDEAGGVYSGSIECWPSARCLLGFAIEASCACPATGEFVVDLGAHEAGAAFRIAGELSLMEWPQSRRVSVNGVGLDVEVSFLGSLPNGWDSSIHSAVA
jgi:hypothetical protein